MSDRRPAVWWCRTCGTLASFGAGVLPFPLPSCACYEDGMEADTASWGFVDAKGEPLHGVMPVEVENGDAD